MNQFDKPDKATFLIVIIFFPVILMGWLCIEGYSWMRIRLALRRARKLAGRPLTDMEKLVVTLKHHIGEPNG